MSDIEFDSLVMSMIRAGVDPDAAGREVARRLGRAGDGVTQRSDADEDGLEKTEYRESDKMARAVGLAILSLDQPRATKQTAGIADRKYYFEPRIVYYASTSSVIETRLIKDNSQSLHAASMEKATGGYMSLGGQTVWFEAKSPARAKRKDRGQSDAQRWFESVVTYCGEEYICGTRDAFVAWLRDKRLAVMVAGVLEPIWNKPQHVAQQLYNRGN